MSRLTREEIQVRKSQVKQSNGECKIHGEYHSDHGCGVAVKLGTSFADHSMRCDVLKTSPYTPNYVNQDKTSMFPSIDSMSENLKQGTFAPWEAPAGYCPGCWLNIELLSQAP